MKQTILFILLIVLVAAASLTLAQANPISLSWWTADGGGGVSRGGQYTLSATTGQPDAGEMGNGRYTLLSGYWDGPGRHDVNLPVVIRP